jgi:intraflagellar transport protein 81
MSTPSELKFIVESLVSQPFSKTWSVIQLHDDLPAVTLLQCLCDILGYIDEADPVSIFKKVDIRNDSSDDFINRLVDFLRMLKMKEALADGYAVVAGLATSNRSTILKAMYFLLKDLAVHKKRAYLGIYLSSPDIPMEFSQDDSNLTSYNSID